MTRAQREALNQLAANGPMETSAHPWFGGGYLSGVCCAALVCRGWARQLPGVYPRKYVITATGIAALRGNE